jgi:hypothetical protein
MIEDLPPPTITTPAPAQTNAGGPSRAVALGVSPRSADFLWAYARAWLLRFLGGADAQP